MLKISKQLFLAFISIFLFVTIALVEVGAHLNIISGFFGMYLWLAAFALFVFLAVYSAILIVKRSIKHHTYFSLLSFFILIAYFLYSFSNPANISGETTQQTACALDFWFNSLDKGFQQLCFLGYPARQYLPMVIPSWLFGRSLVSLNLGGSLYFFVGILLWINGLQIFLNTTQKNKDLLTGLSVLFLLHFHYFNHNWFHCFDQDQIPPSISLGFWGVYLWQMRRPRAWRAFVLGLLLMYLVVAYTPAVAFFILGLLLMVYLTLSKKMSWKSLVAILTGSVISFIITFTFRADMRLVGENNSSFKLLLTGVKQLLSHLFIEPKGWSYSTGLGQILLLVGVLSPIILKKTKLAVLSMWTVMTFVVATVSQGYSFYGLNLRAQRSMVAIPTVLLLVTLFLKKISLSRKVLMVFYLVTAGWGLLFAQHYLKTKEASLHYGLISFLQSEVKTLDEKEQLVFLGEANKQYVSLNDTSQYFLPQITKLEQDYSLELCQLLIDKPETLVVLEKNELSDLCLEAGVKNKQHYFSVLNQELLVVE